MNSQLVQNISWKLQKRIKRLCSADSTISFYSLLSQFCNFFDLQIILVGIINYLIFQFPKIENDIDLIFNKEQGIYAKTEGHAAIIGYNVLRLIKDKEDVKQIKKVARIYNKGGNQDDALKYIRETFLKPFYEYVDEQLDDQHAMLFLIMRYKQRSEWFNRDTYGI